MNKIRLVASLLVLGFMFMALPAIAANTVTLVTSPYSAPQAGIGYAGEFTWQVDSSWALNGYVETATAQTKNVGVGSSANFQSFQSFCLEKTEYINYNNTYNVAYSFAAKNGGEGAIGGVDPISRGTAYLYSQFAAGTLSGYDYLNASNRKSDAGSLQRAIWYLEGEITAFDTTNEFYQLTIGIENYAQDANGAFGVQVLNLTDANNGVHQDQLYVTAVPEPSVLVLLGICLVGVTIGVRKFNIQA